MIVYSTLEQMRAQQRVLRKTTRDLERDRHSLERQEKALVRTPYPAILILCALNIT